MSEVRESITPGSAALRRERRRIGVRGELLLAMLPTVTMLVVLALVEALTRQRLLFASLASSAFLIYLDPEHGANSVRTLAFSHLSAAAIGWLTYALLGPGYAAAGTAMVLTILLLVLTDHVHPPAISTSLSFAFKAGNETNLVLFGLAVGVTATLVLLEHAALWLLAKQRR